MPLSKTAHLFGTIVIIVVVITTQSQHANAFILQHSSSKSRISNFSQQNQRIHHLRQCNKQMRNQRNKRNVIVPSLFRTSSLRRHANSSNSASDGSSSGEEKTEENITKNNVSSSSSSNSSQIIGRSEFGKFSSVEDVVTDQKSVMDEIAWRAKKIALEDAHTQSFLKARPWKLPYEDSRRWVQANLGADTKEDFFDLVANGNLRTPYIPKQPETYYTESGTWVSWDHFLHGIVDDGMKRQDSSSSSPNSEDEENKGETK
eukprot:CAMPEP_0172510160 /NCGR_PEP_ID=MMETSP1066-20121228/226745_1 /TAXON_ID=671091 /ORGANISM="Coscinodiscus wailesii, Strain CCMP2513" /LENGTH=259 /DNA_ID=CAMNT_0013289013 /DNA_START=126 /DNA_END=905 /DNA_ORIENTATION=+